MGFTCPSSAVEDFKDRIARIRLPMLQVNGLTLGNAILAGILVGIGTIGTRYRHRAFVRTLFQGANTLFLPILSYVASNASTTASTFAKPNTENETFIKCDPSDNLLIVLIWAGLVHMVGINTCTIVAASNREGRTIGLPMVLIVQAIWSTYLVVSLLPPNAKMAIRFYEFLKARRSVALGRNPHLIVGYMKQLQGGVPPPPVLLEHPPPLIVVGEDRAQVEKGPHGFFFKQKCHNQDQDASMTGNSDTGLVTMDKVWQFNDDTGLMMPSTTWRLKEVCLSFTLFKLLRSRFAGYTVAEAGFHQVRNFFLHVLLSKDNIDHERVHAVIADELSFLHDYYYSSIPIHYSNFWLPIVNISISVLNIIYCLLLAAAGLGHFISEKLENGYVNLSLIYCLLVCKLDEANNIIDDEDFVTELFGNIVYEVVPVAILLVLVVLAEAREIASYICSNWTKVALFSRCVVNNHDAWQRSPRMRKWIGRVLRRRPNRLMTQWDDKMYQCSVLVLCPRRIDSVISLVTRLLRLPDRKKNVKVPGPLKASIVNTLASNNNGISDPKTFLCQSLRQVEGVCSDDSLQACESKGISDLLLMWHIATSILEVSKGQHSPPDLSGDMIVATHLSRYCAYLVAYVPELLPDDDEWCKSLYKAVKKDSMLALDDGVAAPSATEEARYNRLVSLLEKVEHVVLKNGVKLGKLLVQLQQGEVVARRFLTGFWSGMILYIAPSDNLKGHAEAIARGGELITLVWALLMNVGISSRPSSTEASPSTTVDSV